MSCARAIVGRIRGVVGTSSVDRSLADSDNLPPPEVIAQEIVDDLEAALEQFRLIAGDLGGAAVDDTASRRFPPSFRPLAACSQNSYICS
jgi:hypothetical protein